MRKLLPLVAAVALGIAVVGPLPAQFTVNGITGVNPSTKPTLGPVSLRQMLPQTNLIPAMGNPLGTSKTFTFASMLPNFTHLKTTMGPINPGYSQIPAQYLGQYNKK